MNFVQILLLGLLCISASCGNDSGRSIPTKRYTKLTEEMVQGILSHQLISCDSISGNQCPEGMARLFTINKDQAEKSTVCSGFMVAENTLVTNHHCVPSPSSCRDTYIVIYRGAYKRPLISRCDEIIKSELDYSNPNDLRKSLDYAVLKTQGHYDGEVFELTSDSIRFEDEVISWVIDHTGLDDPKRPNLFEARITEFKCKVDHENGRASMVIRGCPVIQGNSGSPVLNKDGKVVGVIWGGALRNGIDASTKLSKRRLLNDQTMVTDIRHVLPYVN